MNNNPQLTLLLLLKGRSIYTKRWLAYADEVRCPFPILIADGSEDEENANIVKDYLSKLNIQYCRYPVDATYQIYYEKVADAISKIKTPFIVKIDNDDFYDFSVLSQGVGLLQENSDFNSCYIDKITFSIKKPFSIHSYSGAHGIQQKAHAHERLSLYFSGSPGTYYNIYRTPFYHALWQDIVRFKFRDLRSPEYFINMVSYAFGNIATTSLPGYFREESGQGNSFGIEINALKEIMNPNWISEHMQIAEYIAAILVEKDGFDKASAIQFYFDGIRSLLTTTVVHDFLLDSTLTKNNRKKIYMLVLKDLISRSIFNKPLRKIFSIKNNRVHQNEATFAPVHTFLKKWYSKSESGLITKV